MSGIVTMGSLAGFFSEAVEDAIRTKRVEVTGGATSYLVSLLSDYAKPDARAEATLDKPLAFLLDEALHAPAQERFELLRTLGDGVLYSCGFFGEHFVARGVDRNYLYSIGTTAYGAAGSMMQSSRAGEAPKVDIFGEMSGKFTLLVEVIAEVADATVAMGAASSKGIVQVYERWLKTGSDRLANALTSHGVVPVRVAKGLH